MTTPPPVIRAAWVDRPVDEAFAVFTEEIGAWWPLPTHGIYGPDSGSVGFRDGQLVEQSTDGSLAIWAHVRAWEPPSRLVVAWHPGRDVGEASEVAVTFEPDGQGTRVIIEHRGWENFGDDAMKKRLGYVGPNAWGYVLDHFSAGAETRLDAADVSTLEQAYRTFFDEAERGGFGAPPAGQWTAEQTVAHVALNDVAMLAVTQSIVHQNPTTFENEVCQDLDVLTRRIALDGSLDEQIARGRELALLVSRSILRLSPEQLDTPIDCRLLHDGAVVLEQAMPWRMIVLDTQASRHLPAHVQQLQNLRR